MSISLVSQPAVHQPAYNPIEFVFSSTNYHKCDFAYICDLYVNGSFAIRLKDFPDSPNGHGRFRIERILQDFLDFDFDPEVTDFTPNPKGICDYHLEISERYNTTFDCTGQPTTDSVDYTSSKKYAWHAALQYHEYPEYTDQQFTMNDINSSFLSRVPNGLKLSTEDYFTLKCLQALNSGAGTVDQLVVTTYDVDGNYIGVFLKSNPYSGTNTTQEMLLTIPVGPKNISGFVTLGSNVAYYVVNLENSNGDTISERKVFNIDNRCTRFKKYRFWWLNTLDGFDAMTFDLKSTRKLDITKGTFGKILSSNYQIGYRGETVLTVDAKTSYSVASDWLTEEEAIWLEDLFTSPEAYVYEKKTRTKRVKILGSECPDCPPHFFNITGAFHNVNGTVNLFLDDSEVGAGGISTGSFFKYEGTGFDPMGSANSGSHKQITGYNHGLGFYTTNIASTINAGASPIGFIDLEHDPCLIVFTLEESPPIAIGTQFSYFITNGSAIRANDFGVGTITALGASDDQYITDVPCDRTDTAIITGHIKIDEEIITKIPIIISNQSYEEKIKQNIKNIQYVMEFRPSYNKNIQGS